MHLLITDDEHAQLLVNGHARTAAKDFDPVPVVKLFTPDAHATSLLAALDPSDGGHSLATLRRWYRQARAGHDALVGLGVHCRPTQSTDFARSVFPPDATVVVLRAPGATQRFDSRLIVAGAVRQSADHDSALCLLRS